MTLTWKHGALAFAAFCGVIVVVVSTFFLLTASGWEGSRAFFPGAARRCVLEWGRLAPFPASAEPVTLTTEGGAFSRAFRARFCAPKDDVERWLHASPGIIAPWDGTPGVKGSPAYHVGGRMHYGIAPGGGAAHAEVIVGDLGKNQREVTVHVSWS